MRSLLRAPLFASFLGYRPGVRGGAANLKPSASLVLASERGDALVELLYDLKRLDDFCLSNRVVIFNEEDLRQVRDLMAAPAQAPEDRLDRDEARAFLDDAQGHVKDAIRALKK